MQNSQCIKGYTQGHGNHAHMHSPEPPAAAELDPWTENTAEGWYPLRSSVRRFGARNCELSDSAT